MTANTWITLKDLRKGAIFRTRNGVLALKTEYHTFSHGTQCDCYLLESGEAAHFPRQDEEEVQEVVIPQSVLRMPSGAFSPAAVRAARSIVNYCLTYFPTDTPPTEYLDVPWFAEKVQRAIEESREE